MLNVVLIVIGILVVAASFIVSEKIEDKKDYNENGGHVVEVWTEKEEEMVREHIDRLMSEKEEETIEKANDELSRISNEKIMAVSEFSDQILEKIEQNHTEVVFLYNMLNEREKEMKIVIHEMDTVRAELKDNMALWEQTEASVQEAEEETIAQVDQAAREVKPPAEETGEASEENFSASNQNDQILMLYEDGKSIVEIAKMLDIGQGEVKLVIDLFQGGRAKAQ